MSISSGPRPREHAALTRALNQIRLREFSAQLQRGQSNVQAQTALAPFDQFATAFSDAGDELNGLVSDLNDEAIGLKEALAQRDEAIAELNDSTRAGETAAAVKMVIPTVDDGRDDREAAGQRPDFSPNEFDAGGANSPVSSTARLPSRIRQRENVRHMEGTGPRLCRRFACGLPATGKLEPVPPGARGIAAITAFSSGVTGSRPASGRIGTASAHC